MARRTATAPRPDASVPPARPAGASADAASRIAAWQRRAGRHGLPWQHTRDPYRIWLSEIMLQQTQAATVVPYYERFLALFPTVVDLADAPQDAVLRTWAGLGYYARARNLHRCAQALRDGHGGRFPATAAELARLPGIGPSTAAAIAAFAYGERAPILDGNVRRVLARYFAIEGDPAAARTAQRLWDHARALLDAAPAGLDMAAYTQGQMDLGATICTRTRPDCARCPLALDCQARIQGRQDELPTPRTRRAQPLRHCWMLIAECEGRVLLERRPDAGIWGGLWTLPQFESAEALAAARDALPAGEAPQALAAFDHVFTHFRLRIQPCRLRLAGAAPAPDGADRAWAPLAELDAYGMPAPVARLLAGLYADTPLPR
ncbi:A/G-specific adenine glycosylase [Castellaniella defragrans]|uniref:A/G-specific adenine glycosylase n=1 Tax=Castellaniella defragrans TaxID=75697 RepID=UPI0023F28B56|nr:A/G-specific adenine glycosylase [Castellaniella defragrans]